MTYPKEVIVETLRLYVKGLPLNKIVDFMYQHRGYKIYGSRILDWAKKYSELVKKMEKQVKARETQTAKETWAHDLRER